MALPSHEAGLIRRIRDEREIAAGMEIMRYGERLRRLLDAVTADEGGHMDPIKARAVLTCVQDESLKVVLMDVLDDDFEKVCIQLWNTPEGVWESEVLGSLDNLSYDGGEFVIFDQLLGERRLEFDGDEETVGIMEDGVLVTWKLDYPEDGLDWSDGEFRRRFIRLVDEAMPIVPSRSY